MPSGKKSKKSALTQKQTRPPIVTIMGHVDHGKTTLLDAIRKTKTTEQEHGGITQHIGAYQIKFKGEAITFIDTPGHVAFSRMRSRGAQVTDLAVLVIAANEGVKPQTKESLEHIKQAGVPFLVALNKIDLAEASPDMVKAQLAEEGVLTEGYGGDIVCVEVSAKKGTGIDDLLEMILLLAQMHPLESNPHGKLEAVVIESKLDNKQGPLTTLLIKNGALRIGDYLLVDDIKARVRALKDDLGRRVNHAGPSTPIQILGFKNLPPVGIKVKKVAKETKPLPQPTKSAKASSPITKDKEEDKIKLILKADVAGTLEAIQTSLAPEIELIFTNVGAVTESDVLLAASTQSTIIAFNVPLSVSIKELAEKEKVEIKSYNIIYKLFEDLEKKVLKILEPTIDEQILGEAEIIAEFNIRNSHIAGCRITQGRINKQDLVHLKRKGKIIGDGKIKSLQKEKQTVQEANKGEVGLVFSPDLDFKIGDAIITYSKEK